MRLQGNLWNRLDERRKPVKPEVGMGATILMYSDRHAATIVMVEGVTVVVKEDIAVRTDNNGMSENQEYRYEKNAKASPRWFTLRKNGCYVEKGSKMETGTVLLIGERDHYYDYSF